jgi:Mg2+ and Co2+ transporter CorA
MEAVLRDIASVTQSIERVEADVIAVEAAIQEAKDKGDLAELAALRDKENKMRDKENKLRDKENKLLEEKNTLRRLQGTRDMTLWCCASCACRLASRALRGPRAALHHVCRLQSASAERRRVA